MSAVAALAVAGPVAVVTVTEASQHADQAPQRRVFVQAATITDLPNELMSALSQGLSQFGINLPPMPTSLLTGSGAAPTTLTSPGLGAAPLTTPGLGAAPLTTPGLGIPSTPATLPDSALTNPALTNPALTSPAGLSPAGALPPAPGGLTTAPGGLTTAPGGLTTPPALTAPGLGTAPISSSVGLPPVGEVPISAPIGLDPALGTYPVMDPSLAVPASTGASGGLLGDLTSAANQLGAGQAIDLLKGVVMPAIMSAMKPAGAPAAAAAAAPAAAAPITHAVGTTAEAAADGAESAVDGAAAATALEP